MNVSTNIPAGMTNADYNRLMNSKVQLITVSTLPTSDIKTYPYLYILLSSDDSTGQIYEYKDDTWYTYGGGGGMDVDSELNLTSTNPVQNKIITEALNGKAASDHNHDLTYAAKDHTHTIDSDLSTTSTNPVQNKVVTAKLSDIESQLGGCTFGVTSEGILTITYDDGT